MQRTSVRTTRPEPCGTLLLRRRAAAGPIMTALYVRHTPSTSAHLDQALARSPAHLRPVMDAICAHHVSLLYVTQGLQPFAIPRDPQRSTVVIIGDDNDRADGPGGFHLPSLRRVIRASVAFAVVSSAPPTVVYASMTAAAVITRRNILLIETRPEQELQWVSLIQKYALGGPLWLATVKGGHA